MSFIWPWMLASLPLVPVGAFLYSQAQQRQRLNAVNLGTLGIVRGGGGTRPGRRRLVLPVLFLLGVTLLLLAMARPEMVLPVPRVEGNVMLVLDVSASMAADDLKPTRMAAAKSLAQAFIEEQPRNVKIGVVAFSTGGLVVQTPTDDRPAIAATIDRLVPQSGTSLGQGILAALDAVSAGRLMGGPPSGNEESRSEPRGAFAPAAIVLLTDGENTGPPDPLEAAQAAIEKGVRVHSVGIGTTEGATVQLDGFTVATNLNEEVLREIALLTEGDYFSAEDADDLRTIYADLDPQFVVRSEKMEITSVLGGISLFVLLIGGALSLLWFGRVP